LNEKVGVEVIQHYRFVQNHSKSHSTHWQY
ncbi:hypothetical protein KM1_315590, partial [Entamoeba histolytica HM-3:IMSS]